MMRFSTDKETLDDLNIFGRNGSGSILSIFDLTSTRGGAALLNEMFQYPLADADLINNRGQLIRLFSSVTAFPFDVELFDIAEQYLKNTDQRTKLSYEGGSAVKRLRNFIVEDPGQKFVYSGVRALTEIIISLRNFLDTFKNADSIVYQADFTTVTDLLADTIFDDFLPNKRSVKLSYEQIAAYDVMLRFKNRELIRKLLEHIYYLDVYITVGKIARERGFVFPKAWKGNSNKMVLEEVFHPQLKNAITNNFGLSPDNNVTFLTGANMAGKSTFMKSVGVAMFLAHMGFPVPAKRLEFTVLDGMYTTINLPDNLGMGTSHFYAEVLRVKKIAQELSLGKNLFIIIDELFRGTNVKDAYEATVTITEAFAKKCNSMFVISTHIIEAGDVLKQRCKNIDFKYLPTLMDGNSPVYTYKLKDGITADRHGMIIINNEGVLDILKKGKEKKV